MFKTGRCDSSPPQNSLAHQRICGSNHCLLAMASLFTSFRRLRFLPLHCCRAEDFRREDPRLIVLAFHGDSDHETLRSRIRRV